MAIYYNTGKVLAELELWLYDCIIKNRSKNKVKEEVIDKIDELKKKHNLRKGDKNGEYNNNKQ